MACSFLIIQKLICFLDRIVNVKKAKRTIPSGVKSNWDKDEVFIPLLIIVQHRLVLLHLLLLASALHHLPQ